MIWDIIGILVLGLFILSLLGHLGLALDWYEEKKYKRLVQKERDRLAR